jgi:hypothetical protein
MVTTTLLIFARRPVILLNARRTVFPPKFGLMSILRKGVTRASTNATLGLMLAQPIVILPDALLLLSRRMRKLPAILIVVASLVAKNYSAAVACTSNAETSPMKAAESAGPGSFLNQLRKETVTAKNVAETNINIMMAPLSV